MFKWTPSRRKSRYVLSLTQVVMADFYIHTDNFSKQVCGLLFELVSSLNKVKLMRSINSDPLENMCRFDWIKPHMKWAVVLNNYLIARYLRECFYFDIVCMTRDILVLKFKCPGGTCAYIVTYLFSFRVHIWVVCLVAEVTWFACVAVVSGFR